MSPDGRHVYVAASGSGAIAAFARNRRSGALRQLRGTRGCVALGGRGRLRARAGAGGADGGHGQPGRPPRLRRGLRQRGRGGRSPATAEAGRCDSCRGARGCLGPAAEGCTPARGLRETVDVTVSPDGRHLYVASEAAGHRRLPSLGPGQPPQEDVLEPVVVQRVESGCHRLEGHDAVHSPESDGQPESSATTAPGLPLARLASLVRPRLRSRTNTAILGPTRRSKAT